VDHQWTRLLEDTAIVKRMLVGTANEHMEDKIVTAYLQAHLYDPVRVHVVVEEMGDTKAMEDSPELVREPSLEQPKELANVKQAITEPVIAEEAIAEQGIMEQVILAAAGPAVWAAAVASPEAVALAERLSEMFPNTPLDYLLHRCEDLAGHDSAIERFTEELLADSRPLPGWLAAGQEAGAGQSGLGPGPGLPDPLQVWARERTEQLQSMFPLVCPDHLLAAVTRITGAEESVRAQQVTGADTAAF
jgi:hypothetical protein